MSNKRSPFQERFEICFRRSGPDGRLFQTEQEFADVLGVSRPSVNMWLNGKRVPNHQTLAQIASKLDVSADWLMGIADENEYSADETVKLASKYTGLSQKSIETLHQLLTLGAENELLAANFLFEHILFYKDVLSKVSEAVRFKKITCDLENPFDDPLDSLSDEEAVLYEKLLERGLYSMPPYYAMRRISDDTGDALAYFLKNEFDMELKIDPDSIVEWRKKEEDEYLSSLRDRKEFIEHENT